MPDDADKQQPAVPGEPVPVEDVALESLDKGYFIRIVGRKGLSRLNGLMCDEVYRYMETGEMALYEN